MALRFCVLGSGSSGNASYVEGDGFGVLLDVGLGPRRLARGLAEAGAVWEQVRAVVLTHTHTDHWNDNTFKQLLQRRIALYCHRRQIASLRGRSELFQGMELANLVRGYDAAEPIELGPLRCLPFEVPHDDEPTCGFRIEGPAGTLGYAADLGSWTPAIAQNLSEVDILAVELNHDVDMERSSGRAPMLVDRVLGDRGHLSNDQGADLVTEVLRRSEPGRVRHLVLLHLSRQCNHPELAQMAAAEVVDKHARGLAIHVAHPNNAGPVLTTGRRPPRFAVASTKVVQHLLPGWDDVPHK